MNFLAHAFLSGEDEKILAGNFFADFIKGKQALAGLDAGIARGIALHRQIDAFTDTHPIVGESKNRLRSKYRHYAGVIVDVFYDHFLALNWNKYHHQPLAQYTHHVYKTIEKYLSHSPTGFSYMFGYMQKNDWLLNYGRIEGIGRALTGMSQRTPYESKMDQATDDLRLHFNDFAKEFELFFPQLQNHCAEWLLKNQSLV